MSKVDMFDELYARDLSPLEFSFENMCAPPLQMYLSQYDIDALYNVASSIRYAGNINLKYARIDEIMKARGFRKYATGTNRTVYKCMEDISILIKIAIDRVGLSDSAREFDNQFLLKPFVTKTFQVDPSGATALVERVDPITSREEYIYVAPDIYDLLAKCMIGKFILEDIGSNYFMNWGIRKGFGPVLLDYPYLYELDGNKLYCNTPITPGSKIMCGGEIDYDIGFNKLICTRCGKQYQARELQAAKQNKLIIIKEEDDPMSVKLVRGNTIVCDPNKETDIIKKPKNFNKPEEPKAVEKSAVKIIGGSTNTSEKEETKQPVPYKVASPSDIVEEPKQEVKEEEPAVEIDTDALKNAITSNTDKAMSHHEKREETPEPVEPEEAPESAIMQANLNISESAVKTEEEILAELGIKQDFNDPRDNFDRNGKDNKEKYLGNY